MKKRLTIRIAAVLFATGLMGSTAAAANVSITSPDLGQYVGWCDSTCHGMVTDTLEAPYPAYQPLEVCDDICYFL